MSIDWPRLSLCAECAAFCDWFWYSVAAEITKLVIS